MPFRTLRKFLQLESSSGIILFAMALFAIGWANSPWHDVYFWLQRFPLKFSLYFYQFHAPVLLWVNDGLMTLFFLMVGLEIKREMLVGELNSVRKAMLPAIAAIGGMVVPALIYFLFNRHQAAALNGWAIPTATDIAFSLGILYLLGTQRIPIGLKIFLMALAIFDDLGAIIVIAVFYTQTIMAHWLLGAAGCLMLLILMNIFNVQRLFWYLLVGIGLWICVIHSGVHATIAGVLLAWCIPLSYKESSQNSPLKYLEQSLLPWVAYFILPLFALLNAGVSFAQLSLAQWTNPITVGIAFGLLLGKPIGILSACWLATRTAVGHLPHQVNWRHLIGASLIAGVGFTMSLFIGGLAFGQWNMQALTLVRLGVLSGSLMAGLSGYLVLRCK